MDINKWLGNSIIFECIAGSHAYGLNTEASDTDYRGVCIPPRNYFLGAFNFNQHEQKDPDRVIYGIKKFIKLAIDNNPNILEFLFMPEDCIIKTTPLWKQLEDNREEFLSKKVRFTYAGYAFSQIKRVKTHRNWLLNPPKEKPTREAFGLPIYEKLPVEIMGAITTVINGALKAELETIIATSVSNVETLSDLIRDNISLTIENSLIEFVIPLITKHIEPTTLSIDIGKKFFSTDIMAIYEKERAYKNAMNHWEQYQTWVKNRNPKRSELEKKFGYDCKHMSHVFRLLIQGKEILEKGTLSVRLSTEDRELCRNIRLGGLSYDYLLDSANTLMNTTFDELYRESTIRKSVNVEKIDALQIDIIERFLYGT